MGSWGWGGPSAHPAPSRSHMNTTPGGSAASKIAADQGQEQSVLHSLASFSSLFFFFNVIFFILPESLGMEVVELIELFLFSIH